MIGLVYLVWTPLGPEPLREFLRSYCAHAAGTDHELVIVLNGDGPREALLTELDGVEHRLIALDRPVLDLTAYGLAVRELSHRRLCFLNSYSVVLVDDWLMKLERALDEPGVGLAGASASWESQAEWVRGKARYWLYQLARLPNTRRDYPRFPNPHIRTTAFIIDRELVLELRLEDARDKRDTYLLESGRDSITRRVLARGRRAVVVGRDGGIYDPEDWPLACVYRSGGQRELLIADRRTRDWEIASARLRRRLSRDAWGERYVGPGGIGRRPS